MTIVVFQPEIGEYRLSFKLDKKDVAVIKALLIPTAFVSYQSGTGDLWTIKCSESRPMFKYMSNKIGVFQDLLYLAYKEEDHTIKSEVMSAKLIHNYIKTLRQESKAFKTMVNDNLILMDIKVKLV